MSHRIWTASHVFQEGQPIRYLFYSTEETEQFMHGPVPKTVTVILTPKDALDLAWSLFEDVCAVAPDLPAPSVSRGQFDLLDRTMKEVKASVEAAMEELPRRLKQMDEQWKGVQRLRPPPPNQAAT